MCLVVCPFLGFHIFYVLVVCVCVYIYTIYIYTYVCVQACISVCAHVSVLSFSLSSLSMYSLVTTRIVCTNLKHSHRIENTELYTAQLQNPKNAALDPKS